jgi:hypothetical protein
MKPAAKFAINIVKLKGELDSECIKSNKKLVMNIATTARPAETGPKNHAAI